MPELYKGQDLEVSGATLKNRDIQPENRRNGYKFLMSS